MEDVDMNHLSMVGAAFALQGRQRDNALDAVSLEIPSLANTSDPEQTTERIDSDAFRLQRRSLYGVAKEKTDELTLMLRPSTCMLLTSLFAASALAWQTSAFLIPLKGSPEAQIPPKGEELRHRIVDLDCPNCPFAGPDGNGSIWTVDDKPISVHLEFDITDDDGHNSLKINGQPAYPPPRTLVPLALEASQTRESDQSTTAPLRLGYALEFLPPSRNPVMSITTLHFTILDLEGISVNVDTVEIVLIESRRLAYMARVARIPYSQSPGADRCATSICRLRAIIAHRLRKMIEGAKACACKAGTWLKNCCRCLGRKNGQGVAEQDHQHHHHHHAHNRHGRLRHFIQQTFRFYVLPVLYGVFGGLVVCALGTLVARAFVHCWNRSFSREGGRGLPRNGEIAVETDEKEALMQNGEMPPQYQDVDVVVVEEK